tara:strand:+ start:280 stop:510 length:231 start_codon:yes stop_codon:yes gene_type:complete
MPPNTMNQIEIVIGSNKTIDMERTYKTIKWILKDNIKKNVRSLWTWKDDNFTMIYDNYSGDDRIYTSTQLLKLLTK